MNTKRKTPQDRVDYLKRFGTWLEQWDEALDRAERSGRTAFICHVYESNGEKGKILEVVQSARTAHPAFLPVREAQ